MERNMTSSGGNEVTTVAALQAFAEQTGKRGSSKAPDWKQVSKSLRGSTEEQALKVKKDATAKQAKEKRAAKKASKVRRDADEEANAAGDHPIFFYRDGAIVEDGEETPAQGVAVE